MTKAPFSWFFLLALALGLSLSISAHPGKDDGRNDDGGRDRDRQDNSCRNDDQVEHATKTPVRLVGVVPNAGPNPLSTDLLFADSITERVYAADRGNAGVDVLDGENNVFVGRIPGFVSSGTNGTGPNGVLTTNDKVLWAGDGNSTLRVADVDPAHISPLTYLTIVKSISTVNPECDDGTNHFCNRADELGWDLADHLILVNNDRPQSTMAVMGVHPNVTPYGTWVSTATLAVVGQVLYPGAGGAEQPVWDPAIRRFLVTLPGVSSPFSQATIAVIKPGASTVEKYYKLGDITGIPNCSSANGLALGVHQHLLASACGFPVILSALTGKLINAVTQVGGGDEVWANPGDERFYVSATDLLSKANPQPAALGVIDQESGQWLQNVDAPGLRNLAAFAETNHIFAAATIRAGTPDTSVCTEFGVTGGTGCFAFFDHDGTDPDDH